MPSSLSRRKRGVLIGLTLMSAAALVAFGTARYQSRKQAQPDLEAGDEELETEKDLDAPPSLWQRARDLSQAAYLLVMNRRTHDS